MDGDKVCVVTLQWMKMQEDLWREGKFVEALDNFSILQSDAKPWDMWDEVMRRDMDKMTDRLCVLTAGFAADGNVESAHSAVDFAIECLGYIEEYAVDMNT